MWEHEDFEVHGTQTSRKSLISRAVGLLESVTKTWREAVHFLHKRRGWTCLGAIILPGRLREVSPWDVASLPWQVLLLPDWILAWDKGLCRPPPCLSVISISTVSWTVTGYKQSKRIEEPGETGILAITQQWFSPFSNVEAFVDFDNIFLWPSSTHFFWRASSR